MTKQRFLEWMALPDDERDAKLETLSEAERRQWRTLFAEVFGNEDDAEDDAEDDDTARLVVPFDDDLTPEETQTAKETSQTMIDLLHDGTEKQKSDLIAGLTDRERRAYFCVVSAMQDQWRDDDGEYDDARFPQPEPETLVKWSVLRERTRDHDHRASFLFDALTDDDQEAIAEMTNTQDHKLNTNRCSHAFDVHQTERERFDAAWGTLEIGTPAPSRFDVYAVVVDFQFHPDLTEKDEDHHLMLLCKRNHKELDIAIPGWSADRIGGALAHGKELTDAKTDRTTASDRELARMEFYALMSKFCNVPFDDYLKRYFRDGKARTLTLGRQTFIYRGFYQFVHDNAHKGYAPTQDRLAGFFGVSKRTIAAWTKKGRAEMHADETTTGAETDGTEQADNKTYSDYWRFIRMVLWGNETAHTALESRVARHGTAKTDMVRLARSDHARDPVRLAAIAKSRTEMKVERIKQRILERISDKIDELLDAGKFHEAMAILTLQPPPDTGMGDDQISYYKVPRPNNELPPGTDSENEI